MHFRPLLLFCVACALDFPAIAAPSGRVAPAGLARAVSDGRLAELEKGNGDRPVDSILEQALAWDERGQEERAAALDRSAATQGVGVAELRLGWFNESGQGTEQNYVLARAHCERAAAAAFHLAGMHLFLPALCRTPDHEEIAEKLLALSALGGEYAAAEVLEEIKAPMPVPAAFMYVMKVPVEDRYIQRLAARPPTVWEREHRMLRPRPVKMVTPIYPSATLLTKTEAKVSVEFIVDTTGRVRDAKWVETPHPAFAEPAVAAIIAWRFIPATKEGHGVNTRVRLPIQFRLNGVVLPHRNTPALAPAAASAAPAGL